MKLFSELQTRMGFEEEGWNFKKLNKKPKENLKN